MSAFESVAAVILTHNRLPQLKQCLDSIHAQTHPVAYVIVVDNGSTDGTGEFLANESELTVVTLAGNSGSAGGFGAGTAAAARTDAAWWWIMDDDCAAATDALAHLLAACGDAETCIGGASPKVIFSDGLSRCGIRWEEGPLQTNSKVPVEIDWAPFLGLLLRAVACRAVGPIRNDFFMWNDDAEYCVRLQQAGWRLVGVPRAEFTHPALIQHRRQLLGRTIHYPAAAPWRMYYGARNSFIVARMRGETKHERVRITLRFLGGELGRILIWALAPRTYGRHISMRLLGLLDGVRGRMGPRVPPGTASGADR